MRRVWRRSSTTSPGSAGSAPPSATRETGLPYAFSALPRLRRLELWWGAATLLLPQSRYAALLVSLHGTLLVERFPPEGGEHVQQASWATRARARLPGPDSESLRGDPAYGPHVTVANVERNRELIFVWDGLSLAVLHGITTERTAAGHTLAPQDGDPTR